MIFGSRLLNINLEYIIYFIKITIDEFKGSIWQMSVAKIDLSNISVEVWFLLTRYSFISIIEFITRNISFEAVTKQYVLRLSKKILVSWLCIG
jgi:hypothetical protein